MNASPAPSQVETTSEEEGSRFPIPPGAVVLILLILLIGVIVIGVIVSRDSSGEEVSAVTIAELRADPDRFDNREVELRGSAEDIRELPYLSQYAIYTFRDQTGTMLALTRRGAPPSSAAEDVRLRATFHSRVTLDDELKRLVEEELGPIAGRLVGALLPGIPLDVVFLEHRGYETQASPTP